MDKISATRAYYIKLGRGGEWERDCIANGSLRFGYHQANHDDCLQGRWDNIADFWIKVRGNRGAGQRDANQIRAFYESGPDTVFVTFHDGMLHWCRPKGEVLLLQDKSKLRTTVDGWHKTSLNGTLLSRDRLSGDLIKVEMFRGTICGIAQKDYLLRRINDQLSPQAMAAETAEAAMLRAIRDLMKILTWKDFELLVELVFSASGWRRIGTTGKTQKTVDIELLLPTTGERVFVQVKSYATKADLEKYSAEVENSALYGRMFFVYHSGDVPETANESIIVVGPERLARMVLDLGLWSWLKQKAA